ncbi:MULTISPECIES: MFS transporter [Corynebacterium]|uniref:MFS transporter n=1 Tax=Corynebacterium TaxID=1716 RepID=UPI001E503661|nr:MULTISPECIES: MFS transporter [Corynebacterium]
MAQQQYKQPDQAQERPAGIGHKGRLFGGALGFQNIGDQLVNPKTTLPWFINAIGAPAWILSLLVPLRESLAMLPQAAIRPFLLKSGRHRLLLLTGTAFQGVACLLMVVAVAIAAGAGWEQGSPHEQGGSQASGPILLAGLTILAALTLLALARSLVSLTSSDVKGKLIPKGVRGRVTGFATTIAGAVAITVGVLVQLIKGELNSWGYGIIFATAAAGWALSFVLFAVLTRELSASNIDKGISEPEQHTRVLTALKEDKKLLKFVTVRSMLLVTALSPPFIVTLAHGSAKTLLTGLGAFIIASGLASLLSGQVAGYFSDISSRITMAGAALAASLLIGIALALHTWIPQWSTVALPLIFFGISLAHAVIRVARATYVVDMAEGEQRTTYISVANTAMGVILLIAGALTSALSAIGPMWALGALGILGLVGAISSWRLEEVSLG